VVGVGRGHADVDHCHIRLVRPHLAREVLGVARLRDDLMARLLEQPHDALAHQYRVVGHHYAHGIAAFTVVPSPGRLFISRTPSRAATRSASPRRPDPTVGSAPPTPSSRTSTVTPDAPRSTRTCALVASA